MLHLFNKVYLEIDDKIDIHLDRAVISSTLGFNIAVELEKHSSGILLYYTTDGLTVDYKKLFEDIKAHSDESGKRFFIYCDPENFIRVAAGWLKSFTNIDRGSFDTFLDCFIHKEKIQQGRNWVGEDQSYIGSIKNHYNIFDTTNAFNPVLDGVNLSFEFNLASYLFDASSKSQLAKQMSMFMRRMYEEIFIDVKSMLLMNILSPEVQTVLGGSGKDVNNFQTLPKIGIFLDPALWDDSKPLIVGSQSSFKWSGLTTAKATELSNLILEIHQAIEFLSTDEENQRHWGEINFVIGKDLSESELEQMVNTMLINSRDFWLIPKTDFVNVNYVFCRHLANLKNTSNSSALAKFTLK